MDKALLTLLGEKDFAFITVKEICEAAGVNRSTFYLHYETLGDLLQECVEHMNRQFLDYMKIKDNFFAKKLHSCSKEELYLVTPEYLVPYLSYIRDHQRLFRTVLDNASVLRLDKSYEGMLQHVLIPILERFGVPEQERGYMMAFYMQGMMAVIRHWLEHNCEDPIEQVVAVLRKCVMTNSE